MLQLNSTEHHLMHHARIAWSTAIAMMAIAWSSRRPCSGASKAFRQCVQQNKQRSSLHQGHEWLVRPAGGAASDAEVGRHTGDTVPCM